MVNGYIDVWIIDRTYNLHIREKHSHIRDD